MTENDSSETPIATRPDIEILDDGIDSDRLRRAKRIRERSQELVAELGAEHPLVAQALQRAEALEREARAPGQIFLR